MFPQLGGYLSEHGEVCGLNLFQPIQLALDQLPTGRYAHGRNWEERIGDISATAGSVKMMLDIKTDAWT